MIQDLAVIERDKYRLAWKWPGYRGQADGLTSVRYAYAMMGCQPGETLIDWGCGSGRPTAALARLGLNVIGFDIAINCLDPGSKVPLVVGTLWDPPASLMADYAFSADVLEHIPPEKLDDAMDAIVERTSKAAYIQVCCLPDEAGKALKPPQVLHLSVHPPEWWREALAKRWLITDERQLQWGKYSFICRKL